MSDLYTLRSWIQHGYYHLISEIKQAGAWLMLWMSENASIKA